MIGKLKYEDCTGCSACYNICPKQCISMVPANDGFLYPEIDKGKCVECGLCEKACPSLQAYKSKGKHEPIVKAAWSSNEEIRFNSTSGGIFSELASCFLQQGGYVVGARYNEEFLVEHYIINKIEDIAILRQSKYVQSDKKDVFSQIKLLLEDTKKVLFVGSPCEVAGLSSFLNKQYDNLLTVDFVCLGSNSPKVYRKFLEMIEDKYGSKVKKVWFKNKTYGWNRFSTKVELENGESYLEDRNNDYFMRGYIGKNKFYIRPSCTKCKYKKIPRIADLTLADFWGIANKDRSLDEDKGTSLVMINSPFGRALFEQISEKIYSCDCTLEDAIGGNFAIFNSAKLDSRRDEFFRDMDKMRFDKLIDEYCRVSWRSKVKSYIRCRLSKIKL